MRYHASPWPALAAVALTLMATIAAVDEVGRTRPISSGQLAQNPDDYYGTHVRVRGEVARVIDRHTFLLDEDRPFAGPDVLVLVPRPLVTVEEGEELAVTGYVRRFVPAELRRDYDWFDAIPSAVLAAADERPVLVADLVAARSLDERNGKRRARIESRTLEPIGERPLAEGRRIHLSNVRVRQVLGRSTFTVRDDGGQEVVVRLDPPARRGQTAVEVGETVDVSGVVRRVPRAVDAWHLEDDEAREYVKAKAVFVEARRVVPEQ